MLTCFSLIFALLLFGCSFGSDDAKPKVTATILAPTATTATIATPAGAAIDPGSLMAVTTVDTSRNCTVKLDDDQTMKWQQLKETAACVSNYFVWPEARQTDFDWFFDNLLTDKEGHYVTGYEYAVNVTTNRCAWYTTWLDARSNGNTNDEQASLHMIVSVVPNYQSIVKNFPPDIRDPTSINHDIQLAQRAMLGDPGPIQDFVDAQCVQITHWRGQ